MILRRFFSRKKSFGFRFLTVMCISEYDWQEKKISDLHMEKSQEDLSWTKKLIEKTLVCQACQQRKLFDQKVPGIDYCSCQVSLVSEVDSWQPYLEREHIIVWRKPHSIYRNLYKYKVYGTYSNVSLLAFMEVQLNTNYRLEWDDSVIDLRVLSSDNGSNSDLMYWLVKYPTFFANRDYLFKRRFKVDQNRNEVVIVNELAEERLSATLDTGAHHVQEYWSVMVIRALTSDTDEDGIEYSLTYFDNPGTGLPQSVINFIASSYLPAFLQKLYDSALYLQDKFEFDTSAYSAQLLSSMRSFSQKELMPIQRENGESDKSLPYDECFIELIEGVARTTSAIKRLLQTWLRFYEGHRIESDVEVPFSQKNSHCNLLEALEIVTPDIDEKQTLRKEALNDPKVQLLLEKLHKLRQVTESFRKAASIKKASSLQKMSEMNKRQRRNYSNFGLDEALVFKLFISIKDTLEADKNLRTGKGFLLPEEQSVMQRSEPEAVNMNCPHNPDEVLRNIVSSDWTEEVFCSQSLQFLVNDIRDQSHLGYRKKPFYSLYRPADSGAESPILGSLEKWSRLPDCQFSYGFRPFYSLYDRADEYFNFYDDHSVHVRSWWSSQLTASDPLKDTERIEPISSHSTYDSWYWYPISSIYYSLFNYFYRKEDMTQCCEKARQ